MPRKPTTGWSRPLSAVLHVRGGVTLRTLHDARDYVLGLPRRRQHERAWQRAAQLMLAASKGGDVEAATRQIDLALLLNMQVDYSRAG